MSVTSYTERASAPNTKTFNLETRKMKNDDLIALLAEALELEPAAIETDKLISGYEEWNSLAWLTIMSLLDERFGIQLSGQEIRSFRTVNDFVANITAKAVVA